VLNGDKGYDSDALRQQIRDRGTLAVTDAAHYAQHC
jgi:hypothetical protein